VFSFPEIGVESVNKLVILFVIIFQFQSWHAED
jgi:hypothetical protein